MKGVILSCVCDNTKRVGGLLFLKKELDGSGDVFCRKTRGSDSGFKTKGVVLYFLFPNVNMFVVL